VVDDYLVDATGHALREISLGDEAAYRISDFPVSAEVVVQERDDPRLAAPQDIGAQSGAVTTKPGAALTRRAGLKPVRCARVAIRRRVVAVSRPA
jgi:hypothetical protein